MKILKTAKKFSKKLKLLDYLIILAVLAGILALFLYFHPQEKWIQVLVFDNRVTPIKVDSINIGDTEKNPAGQKTAEVLAIESYNIPLDNVTENLYVKLNLLVQVNSKTGEYLYKGKNVKIGSPLQISLDRTAINGFVADIEGFTKEPKYETKTLTMNLYGVKPWLADSIKVGASEIDLNRDKIVEIISKDVQPAQISVTSANGDVLPRNDPRTVDVTFQAKVKLERIRDKLVFKRIFNVNINDKLNFKIGDSLINAVVTNIE